MGNSYGASQFASLFQNCVLWWPGSNVAQTMAAKTITANGAATHNTSEYKFGTGALGLGDVAAWNALTTEQKMTLWGSEQMYLLAVSDAQAIEESFYEARADAFTQFEAQKQSEFVALQTLWQSKEDADYDVDYEA